MTTSTARGAPRDRVRQNPVPGGDPRNGPQRNPEWCPWHGCYFPARAWTAFRRRAVSGEETPERSVRMLDTAARMRRTCRECKTICPTVPVWAEQVRRLARSGSD